MNKLIFMFSNMALFISAATFSYFLAQRAADRDLKAGINKFIKNTGMEYREKELVNKVLKKERIKKKSCRKLSYKLEALVEKSGIQKYIFFFNTKVLFFICIICAAAFFAVFEKFFGVISVGFITSLPGFFAPVMLLEIMAQRREEKVEKIIGDYLLQLKNNTRIHNDIIEAFRDVQNKCMEPLKTYTSQFVAEVNSGISVEHALENFQDKVNMKRFRLFLTNIRYCYIYGGNFTELLDKTQRLISNIQKEKRNRVRETRSARLVIFILIFLDIYVYFNFIMPQPDYLSIMKNTFYGQLILNVNFISIWFLLWLSYSVKKLDY